MSDFVCLHCFRDLGFCEHITVNATATYCSFCGNEADNPISIEIEMLVAFLLVDVVRMRVVAG